jgi:hypothetical protein
MAAMIADMYLLIFANEHLITEECHAGMARCSVVSPGASWSLPNPINTSRHDAVRHHQPRATAL